MPFPDSVRLRALVACQRHCCLCHKLKHIRIQCHHIIQEADGGANTFENCIPLCPECHSEVGAFNPRHPVGATPYNPEELRMRRDGWYEVIRRKSEALSAHLHKPALYPHSSESHGRASFNYSHFDGFYRIGEGNHEFLTRWVKSSDRNIQCYRDGTNVSLALAPKGVALQSIKAASGLHYESRVQRPQLSEYVVLRNHCERYAAIRILKIDDDTRGATEDRLVFEYWIIEDGGDDFSSQV